MKKVVVNIPIAKGKIVSTVNMGIAKQLIAETVIMDIARFVQRQKAKEVLDT